jgi:hypothetical protein
MCLENCGLTRMYHPFAWLITSSSSVGCRLQQEDTLGARAFKASGRGGLDGGLMAVDRLVFTTRY